MENNIEIGHRVNWSVNKKIHCKGIFIESVNSELSLVRCYEKNGVSCIITLKKR